MSQKRKILVHSNGKEFSDAVASNLTSKLLAEGFEVPKTFSEDVELIVCVGGDGTLLRAFHAYGFPKMPFVGVNTGHLGFFQELQHDELDKLIEIYKTGVYSVQKHRLISATAFYGKGKSKSYTALNDVVVRGLSSKVAHLNLSIGNSFIERFSGDGILIASSTGSTAYNYSLGGSIVDPRLNLMQITPIAPMNTTSYRCFTSSVLLPSDLQIHISPDEEYEKDVELIADGREYVIRNLETVTIELSTEEIKLIRLKDYDFWNKVKTKFL